MDSTDVGAAVLLIALAFLMIWPELWLWQACVTPVTGWHDPSYWQMAGIDGLAALVRAGSRKCNAK